MLQYALKGRTPFIGFGRGAGRREFKQLGFDMNESRERFAEALQIIILAITEERHVRIATEVERCAPGATLLNVSNPLTALCRAASSQTSVRTIGLCNELVGLQFWLSLVFDALTTVFLGVFVVAVARTRQHRDTSPTRPATRTEELVTGSRCAHATSAGRHRRGSATRATNASPAAIQRVHPGRTRR